MDQVNEERKQQEEVKQEEIPQNDGGEEVEMEEAVEQNDIEMEQNQNQNQRQNQNLVRDERRQEMLNLPQLFPRMPNLPAMVEIPRDPVVNVERGQMVRNLVQNEDARQANFLERKKKKNKLDLLKREKKKSKNRTSDESLLAQLIKKKRQIGNDMTKLKGFYGVLRPNEEVSNERYDFFMQFINTSVDVKKLPFAKNLMTKKIIISDFRIISLDRITSDNLFWYCALRDNANLSYASYVDNIESIYLASNKFIKFPKGSSITERYIEDFDPDISSPGWLLEVTADNYDPSEGEITFSAFRKNYKSYSIPNNARVYFLDTVTKNSVVQKLNKSKYVNTKSSLVAGVKVNKKSGDTYFSGRVNLTNFCPSTLTPLGGNVEFSCLVGYTIDPNAFINQIKDTGEIKDIPNFFYWDHLASSMELIGILILTTNYFENRNNNEGKQQLFSCYNFYQDNKKVFVDYRSHFILFKKIVLTFLDSFRTRASIDKMNELVKECNKFLNERETLMAFSEQSTIMKTFVTLMRAKANMMFNFITFEPERYISLILQACSLAVNPNKRIESLSEVLRSTCFKVSQLLFNGDIPMINEIRSVNSFLGTIRDGMEIGVVSTLAEELWAKALNIRNNAERNRLEVQRIKKEGSQGASLNIARGIKTLLEQNNELRNNENLKGLVNRIGYGLENLGVTRQNNPLGLYMTEAAPENVIGLNE